MYSDHFLWNFLGILFKTSYIKKIMGNEFEQFKSCNNVWKSCFFLKTEVLRNHYGKWLLIIKSYIIDIWEVHKSQFYDFGISLV